MDFFGLTSYGISDPIKFFMKPGYEEPIQPPKLTEYLARETKRPFYESLRQFDIYGGVMDGYSYRSFERNSSFKKKGFQKPTGPFDMYSSPVTQSMVYGWWLNDPTLDEQTWYKPNYFMPKPKSETTKFLDQVLKIDKSFVL